MYFKIFYIGQLFTYFHSILIYIDEKIIIIDNTNYHFLKLITS